MADNRTDLDPSNWDPALDAVVAAPKHHKVIFENERLRVLEVTLEPNDEEPIHHHRWPSVFVFDQMQGPVHDIAPDGTKLPPNRDHAGDPKLEWPRMFGRELGAATTRTGFQRFRKNDPRHPN
jgi:hypothetical protein